MVGVGDGVGVEVGVGVDVGVGVAETVVVGATFFSATLNPEQPETTTRTVNNIKARGKQLLFIIFSSDCI